MSVDLILRSSDRERLLLDLELEDVERLTRFLLSFVPLPDPEDEDLLLLILLDLEAETDDRLLVRDNFFLDFDAGELEVEDEEL